VIHPTDRGDPCGTTCVDRPQRSAPIFGTIVEPDTIISGKSLTIWLNQVHNCVARLSLTRGIPTARPSATKRTQCGKVKASGRSSDPRRGATLSVQSNPTRKLGSPGGAPLDADLGLLARSTQIIVIEAFPSQRRLTTARFPLTGRGHGPQTSMRAVVTKRTQFSCPDLWQRRDKSSGRPVTKRTHFFGLVTGRAESSRWICPTLTKRTQFSEAHHELVVPTKRTR
jgi:hypothetical protein